MIENYRSCHRTTMDLQPNLSVLIGPNGSGKTNILQAFMLLNKLVTLDPFHKHRQDDPRAASSRIGATFQDGSTELKLVASLTANTNEENRDVVVASIERWTVKRGRTSKTSF